jgi:hypothetical protein
MPDHPDHFALIVGIDHYPKFRSLKGARRDAERFVAWVTDTVRGGAVPQSNCYLILSEQDPVIPIQDTIDENLEELLEKAKDAAGGRLYLYFSGHGLARSNLGVDLCLAKWSKKRRNMALDSMDYLSLVSGTGLFREIVFFMDCCRQRLSNARGLPSTIGLPRPDPDAALSRTYVAYATQFLQSAFEAAEASGDGEEGEGEYLGHFTKALISGLYGAASDAAGGVPAAKLKSYLDTESRRIATEKGHTQIPEIINGFSDVDEPRFGTALPLANAHITFTQARQGRIILESHTLKSVREGDASTGPWDVPLEKGLYVIREEETGEEKPIRFRLEEGVLNVEF